MATAGTQVTGTTSEGGYTSTPSAGFFGWSPVDAVTRASHAVVGGNYRGTYANSTAYAIGDVVLYNGVTYRAVATVSSSNSTPPSIGATWADATNHRGLAEATTTSHIQSYR
jgi:hypothetical protein